jgi:hypothetical protein
MILILWIRERIHEIGILLSIGVNRYKIIIQFIAELFYISIPSVILSFIIGNGLANKILSEMISREAIVGSANSTKMGLFSMENIITMSQSYGILILIIILSVLFTLGILLMKKPKKILSKMS